MQKIVTIEEAWERKYPEQVVLAITKNAEDRVNLMAISCISIVSDEPPMFLIGIDDHAYTLELIRQNKEFVISYPSSAMTKETLYAGTTHGHHEDKGTKSGLKFIPAQTVNVPILADAVANFECCLETEYRPGSYPQIVGKVIASHVNEDESIKRLVNLGKGYQLDAIRESYSMMDLVEYHKNIGKQLICLKNQVRNLIAGTHCLSDGEHKELILRKAIRDHIGSAYHIGNGFIYCNGMNSTQIDILITKKSSPTLFQEGDFQIVTPDIVSAIIEVKSSQNITTIQETIAKIMEIHPLIPERCRPNCKFGLFAYEYERESRIKDYFSTIITKRLFDYPINWMCLGSKYFIRYWHKGSTPGGQPIPQAEYRLYEIEDMAYSYFINNVILDTNEHTNFSFEDVWFPLVGGKEQYRKAIIRLSSDGEIIQE